MAAALELEPGYRGGPNGGSNREYQGRQNAGATGGTSGRDKCSKCGKYHAKGEPCRSGGPGGHPSGAQGANRGRPPRVQEVDWTPEGEDASAPHVQEGLAEDRGSEESGASSDEQDF